MLMPFTCAWPLRSVAMGAGVGGNVSHLSAASAGRAARTGRGGNRNGRMNFSLGPPVEIEAGDFGPLDPAPSHHQPIGNQHGQSRAPGHLFHWPVLVPPSFRWPYTQ